MKQTYSGWPKSSEEAVKMAVFKNSLCDKTAFQAFHTAPANLWVTFWISILITFLLCQLMENLN